MKVVKSILMVLVLVLLAGFPAQAQIVLGQTDDFNDGSVMGWVEGASSPNPPQNIADGGPEGSGDNFLQNVSAGGFGAGSKMVMDNTTQWTGDFTTAGVTHIILFVSNTGSTDLNLRVAVDGAGGRFSSTNSISLAAGSDWQQISIPVGAGDFTAVGGSDIDATLASVSKLRLLSNSNPSWLGEAVEATLGVDNIMAADGPLSLTDSGSPVVQHHFLSQNYPNPFNPSTIINYTLTHAGQVELTVFDLSGREIGSLVKAYQQPNAYSVIFNATNLASGMYFYYLKVNNQVIATRKMMLLK